MSYDEGSFSGDGTLTGTAGEARAVKVTIAPTPKDGYEWKVLDAGAPSGNDIVLAFSFFERLDEEATAQGRSAPSRELDSDTASVDGGSGDGVELRGAATIEVSMPFNSEGKMSLDRMWMEIQDAGEPNHELAAHGIFLAREINRHVESADYAACLGDPGADGRCGSAEA